MRLKNKTILITGGAARIGLALVHRSLELGYDVIVQYRTHKNELEQWLDNNKVYRGRVAFVRCDLAGGGCSLMRTCATLTPHLVGLVNNAAEFTKGDLLDIKHLYRLLAVNTGAPLRCAVDFYQAVKKGWIINITDASVRSINLSYQNYRISKLFLTEITRQLALLFAPRIRVNAIAPGALLPSKNENKKKFDNLKKNIPLRQTGRLDSAMQAFAYLAENTYVTGQILYVNGGWHLKG